MCNIEVSRDNKGNTLLRQYVDFPSKITSRVVLVGNSEYNLKMSKEGYIPLSIGDIIVELFRFRNDFNIKIFQVTKIGEGENKLEELKENENMQRLISIAKKRSNRK